MILPVKLYCGNAFISIADSRKQKFENIQMRALRIVNGQSNSVQLPTVQQIRNKNCAVDVFKCLNGLGAIGLQGLFHKNMSHKEYSRKQQELSFTKGPK